MRLQLSAKVRCVHSAAEALPALRLPARIILCMLRYLSACKLPRLVVELCLVTPQELDARGLGYLQLYRKLVSRLPELRRDGSSIYVDLWTLTTMTTAGAAPGQFSLPLRALEPKHVI